MRHTFQRQTTAKKMTVAQCMRDITGHENWKPGEGERSATSASCTLSIQSPRIYPALCALTRISESVEFSQTDNCYTFISTGPSPQTMTCSEDQKTGSVTFKIGAASDKFLQHLSSFALKMECSFKEARRLAPNLRFGSDEMTKRLEDMIKHEMRFDNVSQPQQKIELARQ